MPLTLPEPDKNAQIHSARLCELIAGEIEANGGAISFYRFMEMALYQPGLGYYMAGARKFGEQGDFVTAAEISPLFSQCLANQCRQVLEQFERPACILEIGAGSGRMAADILARLARLDCLPDHYYILELSAELRERQQGTIAETVPHLSGSVRWLESLEGLQLHGVILANEVLDAMPVRRFRQTEEELFEMTVSGDATGFHWSKTPADGALRQRVARIQRAIGDPWLLPYESEINPALEGWMAMIGDTLQRGVALLIDYGYTASEYYHPERRDGSLIGHYRHRVTTDPFLYPGLQDITASVDFSSVRDAGESAGLTLAGYTTQAQFLMSAGLPELYAEIMEQNADPASRFELARQIKMLTLPSEMGERFQVMAFSNDFQTPLSGFARGDRRYRL
ncbi:MAG TPA: hypothetical protein ENK26_07190 [Gammaproteobacteria bacterium]|nr:hypothetical protein [Gammaproteobacteria bacterium]